MVIVEKIRLYTKKLENPKHLSWTCLKMEYKCLRILGLMSKIIFTLNKNKKCMCTPKIMKKMDLLTACFVSEEKLASHDNYPMLCCAHDTTC